MLRGPDAASLTVLADDTGSAASSYIDGSVAAATTYAYAVRARNAHGLSPQSDTVSVTTLAAPSPPSDEPNVARAIAGAEFTLGGQSLDTTGTCSEDDVADISSGCTVNVVELETRFEVDGTLDSDDRLNVKTGRDKNNLTQYVNDSDLRGTDQGVDLTFLPGRNLLRLWGDEDESSGGGQEHFFRVNAPTWSIGGVGVFHDKCGDDYQPRSIASECHIRASALTLDTSSGAEGTRVKLVVTNGGDPIYAQVNSDYAYADVPVDDSEASHNLAENSAISSTGVSIRLKSNAKNLLRVVANGQNHFFRVDAGTAAGRLPYLHPEPPTPGPVDQPDEGIDDCSLGGIREDTPNVAERDSGNVILYWVGWHKVGTGCVNHTFPRNSSGQYVDYGDNVLTEGLMPGDTITRGDGGTVITSHSD